MKDLRLRYNRIIYIGDSYSDVCPSRIADLVFAKFILYEKCRENGTACIRYDNFSDVMEYLIGYFSAAHSEAPRAERVGDFYRTDRRVA
jgi:2-hydroxy-3-keto-5-methylthiopentenyl-1-phosphate phosphatase